MRETPKGQNCG